jgi:2-phosphosulfolactate phosphatase
VTIERPWFDQADHRVRFEWGHDGLAALAPHCEVVVVVDVFRFTTCVDVAVGRGAVLYPYPWYDGGEAAFAAERGAALAVKADPGPGQWTLSPAGLAAVPAGTALVLPSPNGSMLCFGARQAGATRVIAGCLRNASAVGAALIEVDGAVGVVAAGERWGGPNGPLRPAVEDLLGAGAVLAALVDDADLSPEARVARAAFGEARTDLVERLRGCGGGRELLARGWGEDLPHATALDVSTAVPELVGDRFVDTSAEVSRGPR